MNRVHRRRECKNKKQKKRCVLVTCAITKNHCHSGNRFSYSTGFAASKLYTTYWDKGTRPFQPLGYVGRLRGLAPVLAVLAI